MGSKKHQVQTIQLLSERGGRSDRELEVAEVLENPITLTLDEVGASQSTKLCRAVGAFENIIVAQDAAERFGAAGIEVELRAVDDLAGESDYRVVLSPLTSLQEAFRRLRELKSRNIDGFVITHGDQALAISLGVFSSLDTAQDHRQTLSKEGYTTKISEIPRMVRGYWIYAKGSVSFPADLTEIVGSELPDVVETNVVCL